ncbi:MAG: glucose-6-phosphate 1-epimerase [Thiomicrorhabdus sp.]|nr:MAG: glucose-6-phosphate 1-epimerase [Thiomicrorhabdus sp.]
MSNSTKPSLASKGVKLSLQERVGIIEVENAFATAKITTHGGSVLSFIPKSPANAQDLLWVSPTAVYSGEKPIRGGIPICWPWFGAHPTEDEKPAHGFVRNNVWQLEEVNTLESGATEVILSFESTPEAWVIWPYYFQLELKIEVGEALTLTLTTTNLSDDVMPLTEAFHTYFNVKNANELNIIGLDNSRHLDKLSNATETLHTGNLVLTPPMDSVYLDQTADVIIEDKGHNRQIKMTKQASNSAVVWNPGPETVKGFADIPDDQWSTFVCVEAGNIFDNAVSISKGEKHSLVMKLSNLTP